MTNANVCYSRREIIRVLRDLNLLVVSIDRIFSPDVQCVDQDTFNRMFIAFFRQLEFPARLADARATLSDAFSYEMGMDNMDELEREMQDLEYWTPPE